MVCMLTLFSGEITPVGTEEVISDMLTTQTVEEKAHVRDFGVQALIVCFVSGTLD